MTCQEAQWRINNGAIGARAPELQGAPGPELQGAPELSKNKIYMT